MVAWNVVSVLHGLVLLTCRCLLAGLTGVSGAVNLEDDVRILSDKLGYIPDEAGDSPGTAANVLYSDDQTFSFEGVITTQDDVDMLRLEVPTAGLVSLAVRPWYAPSNAPGNNLDVAVELRNAGQQLILRKDPTGQTDVTVDVSLPAGTYYLSIDGKIACMQVCMHGIVGLLAVAKCERASMHLFSFSFPPAA